MQSTVCEACSNTINHSSAILKPAANPSILTKATKLFPGCELSERINDPQAIQYFANLTVGTRHRQRGSSQAEICMHASLTYHSRLMSENFLPVVVRDVLAIFLGCCHEWCALDWDHSVNRHECDECVSLWPRIDE
jgi:hypothetical protein